MVIIVPSKRIQVLYAVMVVAAIAIMADYMAPLLLDYLAAHSWPAWVFWVASGFVVVASVPTYWAMLPVGSARVLRSENSMSLKRLRKGTQP